MLLLEKRPVSTAAKDLIAAAERVGAGLGHTLQRTRGLTREFGWGRGLHARLMLHFINYPNFYACDAWDASPGELKNSLLPGNFAFSDTAPRQLPAERRAFTLIFAASLSTHLSEAAASASLSAIRAAIAPDGPLRITVRLPKILGPYRATLKRAFSAAREQHHRDGFAFFRVNTLDETEADGDTSISHRIVEARFAEGRVVRMAAISSAPYKVFVSLRPA